MKSMYLAKATVDGSGNVTGYTVKSRVRADGILTKPVDKYDENGVLTEKWMLIKGDRFSHARIADVSGTWTVLEDATSRDDAAQEATRKKNRKRQLRDKISTIEAEIDAANTVAKLRNALKPLLKAMLREIMND